MHELLSHHIKTQDMFLSSGGEAANREVWAAAGRAEGLQTGASAASGRAQGRPGSDGDTQVQIHFIYSYIHN